MSRHEDILRECEREGLVTMRISPSEARRKLGANGVLNRVVEDLAYLLFNVREFGDILPTTAVELRKPVEEIQTICVKLQDALRN